MSGKTIVGGALAAAAVLATTLGATATPVHAAPSWTYKGASMQPPKPYDDGGKDGWAGAYAAVGHYFVSFNAYGETLTLTDSLTDNSKAYGEVWVYSPSGTLEDYDDFLASPQETFNLGTPDGEGDIPAGWKVVFRVCTETRQICTPKESGRA